MKHLKMLGVAAIAAMAMTAFAAGSASATTLEVGGVAQNGAVTVTESLKTSTSTYISRTDGSLANTCDVSNLTAKTVSPFTGSTVTAQVESLSFVNCTRPVTVHKTGTLHFQHTSGTNGTVTWSGSEITVSSIFGTLNCQTGAGSNVGTLTGSASGHAVVHYSAVFNCGMFMPSGSWKGTYAVTTPTGLGLVA
ncbi:MAG: hypothetical protein M3Y75_06230 [Actinomycetota bacterium]|nr:hypothetical protein [Actinomycetota bacterium]